MARTIARSVALLHLRYSSLVVLVDHLYTWLITFDYQKLLVLIQAGVIVGHPHEIPFCRRLGDKRLVA